MFPQLIQFSALQVGFKVSWFRNPITIVKEERLSQNRAANNWIILKSYFGIRSEYSKKQFSQSRGSIALTEGVPGHTERQSFEFREEATTSYGTVRSFELKKKRLT